MGQALRSVVGGDGGRDDEGNRVRHRWSAEGLPGRLQLATRR
jgi:hypothetical protein